MFLQKKSKEIAWVARHVIDAFIDESRSKFPNETGGILWGYWNEAYTEVVIKNIIGPGPNALHSKYSFIPDDAFHYEEIQQLYEESERREAYLGDWHSHPDGSCLLSFKDKKTLDKIASSPTARMPKPIMAIIAKNESWEIKFWSYRNISIFPYWLGWQQITDMEVKIFY